MATPYAELELSRPVETSAGLSTTLVVMRPTAGILMSTVDARRPWTRITNFLSKACKAQVGEELVDLKSSTWTSRRGRPDRHHPGDVPGGRRGPGGGGRRSRHSHGLHPHPSIPLSEEQTVRQIEFRAKKLGEVADFLNARGATEEFLAFMRNFGRLLGLGIPLTDGVSRALDFYDYLVIRRSSWESSRCRGGGGRSSDGCLGREPLAPGRLALHHHR